MPNHNASPEQQFAAVDELLTRWLRERRQLLTRYTEIAVIVDLASSPTVPPARQKDLCEILVDYVSAGHFEVFSELVHEAESFGDSSALAAALMPDIGDTTEVIMAYEEKYGDGEHYPDTIKRDLSALGEVLESRFAMEDRLIAGLHNRHRKAVASD